MPPTTPLCAAAGATIQLDEAIFKIKKKKIQAVVAQLVVLIMPFVSIQINLIIVFVIREKETEQVNDQENEGGTDVIYLN